MKKTLLILISQPSAIRHRSKLRRGFSMLEMEVAFAAFGILLAGLCPVVVAELKHVAALEARFQASNTDQSGFTDPAGYTPPAPTYYYVTPRPEPWTQLLAGTALVTTATPGSLVLATPINTVTLATFGANPTLTASPAVENATVTIQVVNP